jgi:hypothetical protein
MPSFETIGVSITGSISYEEDFSFLKHKEDLALKVRSESVPRIKDLWSLAVAEVGFDTDGDIRVATEKGTLFVSRHNVLVSVWSRTIASIREGRDLQVVADVLEELFRSRIPLRRLRYAIRSFISIRFNQPFSPLQVQDDICSIRGSKLLSGIDPSTVSAFRWVVSARENAFTDTLEAQVGPTSVDVRQGRDSEASEFPSFREFVLAAGVPAMLERLRPSLEPLIADASKLEPVSFHE